MEVESEVTIYASTVKKEQIEAWHGYNRASDGTPSAGYERRDRPPGLGIRQ